MAENVLKAINLDIPSGQLIALVGASGSGKSTLLRAIAGLEKAQKGEIEIQDTMVFGKGIFVSPQHRKVGMVFQEYALFPHLNVADNIRYGLSKGQKSITDLLEMVGLEGKEKRFPHELSGGEQQRVAIARALAPDPVVLLLDEPFSNLDEALKDQVREDLVRILRKSGKTAILVTHDTRDALATADQIIVLKSGEVQQFAQPQTIYNQPFNEYVARFFGKTNLLEVLNVSEGVVETTIGRFPVSFGRKGQKLLLRPEHFEFVDQEQKGLPAQIQGRTYLGAYTEYRVEVEGITLIIHESKVHTQSIARISLKPDAPIVCID